VAEHVGVVADLEFLRIAGEAELVGLLPDPLVPGLEVGESIVGHAGCSYELAGADSAIPARSFARKARKEGQMSSFRSMTTVWKLSASSLRKRFSIELS